MAHAKTWRHRLLRTGDRLLERVQWLFVLLNCLLAVTSPLDLTDPEAPGWPANWVLLAAAASFGAWSIVYFRRRSGRWLLDVIPLLLLLAGGAAGGGDEWMFARMYVAVFLASLYRPGRGRMIALSASYLAVYEVGVVLSGQPFVVAKSISEAISLVVVVGIMQTLAGAVQRHERFAERDALLTDVVGTLIGERNVQRLNQIVADAAFRLVEVPDAVVTVWRGDGDVLRRVGLAGPEDYPLLEVDLRVLPPEFREIYESAKPATLDAEQLNVIDRHYDLAASFVAAVLAPMLVEGQPSGLIVVGSPEPLDEDLLRVLERFAHEVALAQQLAEREAMLTGLVENSSDVIAVVDGAGTFTYVSAAIAGMTGLTPDEVRGRSLSSLLFHLDVAEPITSSTHIPTRTPTAVLLRSGDRRCDVEVTVNPLADGTTILNIRDISERRRLEAEIEYRAFHDSVTGLPNRELLLDRLDQALRRTQRTESLVAAVVVDLDDFKAVNDTLGHAAGDSMLREIGGRLQATIRDADTAARVGGDEFVLVLESLTSAAEAHLVADRVLDALRQTIQVHGRAFAVSASVGIALSTAVDAPEDLIRKADTAMYAAKHAGKNRARLFEEGMLEQGMTRLELRSELDAAVRSGEFVLHYQPIMTLETGAVAGVEALVRWDHPQRGLLAPNEFIPLAEETGLIVPLGRWILEEACSQLSRWQAASEHPIGLSLNLSAVQLRSTDIIDDVALALSMSGVDAAQLTLEVTETALLHDPDAVAGVLRGLKELGVRLAIDDFGTGYSSFAHLQLLPVDVIKVDRSFVSVVGEGPEQAALAEAIVSIAHALGLETVAEGVESSDHSTILQGWGCAYAQGWLWHPALPGAQISDLLQNAQRAAAVAG